MPAAASQEDSLAAQLLCTIFRFYAHVHDWDQQVVCIRPRRPRRVVPAGVLSIEDPVQPEVDLAYPYMDNRRSSTLHEEFLRGQALMEAGYWDELLTAPT